MYTTFMLGAIAYVVAGLGFHELVKRYLREIEEKILEVDARFVREMYVTVQVRSERQKKIFSIILFVIWPVTLTTVVLKAETALDRVKRHVYYAK